MSHRKDTFSDEQLPTLATNIINDKSTYNPPIDPDFILFKNINSTSYHYDDYIHQSPSPYIESYNSCSTNNISPQYNTKNVIAKDSLSITPHISMDSNFSDSIPTLPPTPTSKRKLKIPKIATFSGNKKSGIKQRLAKQKQNRKTNNKTDTKKTPTSPFNPPPLHIQYLTPKYSYTNIPSIDLNSCISPLETTKDYKKMQSAINIAELSKNNNNNKSKKSVKSNKKRKQKRKKCKKGSSKKMAVKLPTLALDVDSIDLRKFSNPSSPYSPFRRRRNYTNGEKCTTPVPRSKTQSLNRRSRVRANSVVSTRNPIWNNCDLY